MRAGTNVHLLVQGGPKPSLPPSFAPSTPDISDGEGAMLSDCQVDNFVPQITYAKAVRHLLKAQNGLECLVYMHANAVPAMQGDAWNIIQWI
jgi:fatty acid synthase